MISIDPSQSKTADFHQYMLGAIAPRPIAFVSTMSEQGIANLAPYSFFNAFSSRPPIVVFSSNRRVRNNSTKDTLANIAANKEVVINVVNYDMVYSMALASIEYDAEINEFEKSGLTPIASDLVKPFRVKESPVQLECRVNELISLGAEGGAGNLIICEILRMHVSEQVLDQNGRIDPYKMDLMARMGGAYYCRVVPESIVSIVQPVEKIGIGVDALPKKIRLSQVLTGNDLARLATVVQIPSKQEQAPSTQTDELTAQALIRQGKIDEAWQILLSDL